MNSANVDINETDEDYSDPVCAVCRGGGDMICCDGRCFRSFHPACIGLREEDIPEDSPFVCSDCFCGIQRCFCCSDFGIEHELVKCCVPHCGKFYHEKCVSRSANAPDFVCKLHCCDNCGDVVTSPAKRKQLWRCFRCPKAFDVKHRPRDVHVLADGLFLCIRHTQEEEVWPEISKELLERLEKQNKGIKSDFKQSGTSLSSQQLRSTQDFDDISPENSQSRTNSTGLPNQRIGAARAAQREISEEEQEKMRLAKEQKAKVDKEGDILAMAIMPKKRQSAGSSKDFSDDETDSSQKSVTVNSVESRPQQQQQLRRDGRQNHSQLQRHNEARRKKRSNWNMSWNHHRAMQENEMGRTIIGHERFGPGNGFQEPMSVMTPMGNMSRTAALLGTLSHQTHLAQNFSWQRNSQGPATGSLMGGQGLMRTTVLLQSLLGNSRPGDGGQRGFDMIPEPSFHPTNSRFVHPYEDMHDNKRMRTNGPDYHFQPPHPPIHHHHQSFGPPSEWSGPANAYAGPPYQPTPRLMHGMGHGPPLSRTEQLLAAIPPSSTYPIITSTYPNGGQQPLSLQATYPMHNIPYDSNRRMNLGDGRYQQKVLRHELPSRDPPPRETFVPNLPPPPFVPAAPAPPQPVPQIGNTAAAKGGKMDAGDLYAMLLATGMLPAK